MINPVFFIGAPQEVSAIPNVFVYPPTIEQVVRTKYFGFYRQILTTSQEEIEDRFVEKGKEVKDAPTPLGQIFNIIKDEEDGSETSAQKKQIKELIEQAFEFFLHEKVTFLTNQKMILVGDLSEELKKVKSVSQLRLINEDNFFSFQNVVRVSLGEKEIEKPDPNEHSRIKAMKAKARYRDRVKAKKGDGIDLGSSLVALCCMGIGLTPLNIGKISYCAVGRITAMYQDKEKYDTDVRSLQAGAKKKDVNLKYWIRKIDD